MQETLFLILATSLWTIGLYNASREEHILYEPRLFFEKHLGEVWSRPVLSCVYCMPSLHSFFITTVYHHYYGFHAEWYWYFFQWIFIIPSSSVLNCVLFNLIRILHGYADLFDKNDNNE